MKTNRDKCIEMWTIMAKKGYEKHEALEIMGYKDYEIPKSECFACEEVQSNCDKCPITWYNPKEEYLEDTFCYADASAYYRFVNALSKNTRKVLAAKVLHVIKTTWKEI